MGGNASMRPADRPVPVSTNLALVLGLQAATAAALLGIPLLAGGWKLLLVPVALLTTTYWSAVHEGIHGHLHRDRAINDRLGRGLGVISGAPFRALRFGHLLHHRVNRTVLDRAEVYDPRETPPWRARLAHYARLLGGLWVQEMAVTFLFLCLPRRRLVPIVHWLFRHEQPGLPDVIELAHRRLLTPDALAELRRDAAAIVLLYGVSFWLYGTTAWALAAFMLARALIVSFMDNAYHYGNRLDDVRAAYNLRLPRALAAGILNFNYHETHHRYPWLGWRELPEAFQRAEGRFEGGYLRMALRQLCGPIAHRWPVSVAAVTLILVI